MKLSLIALCLFVTAFAQARSPMNQHTVTMNTVSIDGAVNGKAVAVANLNPATKKLSVQIFNDVCGSMAEVDPSLPPQIRCMAMPILMDTFEVPYTATEDGCGSTLYYGSKDLRPADGDRVEVKLVDNSKRLCENYILGLATLEVKVTSARGNVKIYSAYGSKFPKISDDEAIYNALNVDEVILNPGIAGASRTQKSVGGLVCIRSLIIVPDAVPSYSCTLNR